MAMTKNGSWRLERMLQSVIDKADEIIIGVDAATNDDTFERAKKYTSSVFMIDNPEGYVEPHIQTLFEKCSGDWVLRLDDDELISTNFSLEAIPAKVLNEFDLLGLPRAWMVNASPDFYIGTGQTRAELVPQFRLMKRSAQWNFIKRIHTPGFEMKPAFVVPDMFIYHLNLLDRPFDDRKRKFDFYQSYGDAPWNRNYLLDPKELYETGESYPCTPEMYPPTHLIISDYASFNDDESAPRQN